MSSSDGFRRYLCSPKPRACADDIERGTPGARVVARRRDELARSNAPDRSRELDLERGHVGPGERCADRCIRTLEEVVHDVHLRRAAAEARERVDEPLQP